MFPRSFQTVKQNSLSLFTYFCRLHQLQAFYFPPRSYNTPSLKSVYKSLRLCKVEACCTTKMVDIRDDNSSLLAYDTMPTGTQFPAFWSTLLPPYSGYLQKVGWLFINAYGVIFQNTGLFTNSVTHTAVSTSCHALHKTSVQNILFIHTWQSGIGEHSYLCYNMVPCTRGTQAF
jgi:hypothetical protein